MRGEAGGDEIPRPRAPPRDHRRPRVAGAVLEADRRHGALRGVDEGLARRVERTAGVLFVAVEHDHEVHPIELAGGLERRERRLAGGGGQREDGQERGESLKGFHHVGNVGPSIVTARYLPYSGTGTTERRICAHSSALASWYWVVRARMSRNR